MQLKIIVLNVKPATLAAFDYLLNSIRRLFIKEYRQQWVSEYPNMYIFPNTASHIH